MITSQIGNDGITTVWNGKSVSRVPTNGQTNRIARIKRLREEKKIPAYKLWLAKEKHFEVGLVPTFRQKP